MCSIATVPIDKLRPGQILAEAVRDINGRLLLAGGNQVKANHIRIFKIWGISEVTIARAAEHPDKSDPTANVAPGEHAEERVKVLFKHVDLEHPAVKELYRISVQFRHKHNLLKTGTADHSHQHETSPDGLEIDFREKLKNKNIVLPELPSVVFELNEVISDPMSSAENIARVVNTSPSLTAILLKIVNSSFYSFPSKIDTVSHAVTLIGTREISGLVLGICILSIFKKIPKKLIDMYSFVKHSLACGILCRILAARKNLPQTEQMFVSGLLHDLGRLILYIYFPDEAHTVLSRARVRSNPLYEEEHQYLGCNHAQVGKLLMKQWKLPLTLENNIFFHHQPSQAPQPDTATIVHLADIVVNALGIGSSGEKFVPSLDYNAWKSFELSPSSFESIIGQAMHQFSSLDSILDV
jgi:HD-like signal output (HDOD) protein